MKDKSYYEELINQSPVFSIDPEKNPYDYEREKNRLIEHIYLYKMLESSKYEEYALEIVEVLSDCLKSYRRDAGPFLHYYNAAFSRRYRIVAASDQLKQQSGGIHFTRKERELAGAVSQYLKAHPGIGLEEMGDLLESFLPEKGFSRKDLEAAVSIYHNSVSVSGDAHADGNESDLTVFDMLHDHTDFTDELQWSESVKEWIDLCEKVYLESRAGSRELLAIKLTNLLTAWDRDQESGAFAEYICKKSFFDENTFQYVVSHGVCLQNTEISRKTGKSTANITQVWKRFLEKLRSCHSEV